MDSHRDCLYFLKISDEHHEIHDCQTTYTASYHIRNLSSDMKRQKNVNSAVITEHIYIPAEKIRPLGPSADVEL